MTVFQLILFKQAWWKNDSRIHLIFLILVLINSFSCKEELGVYPYMDEWETFNETLLPKKEEKILKIFKILIKSCKKSL